MRTKIAQTLGLTVLMLAAAPVLPAAATAAASNAVPQEYLFEIRRDGSPVGRHRVWLNRTGADLRAEAHSEIVVRMLGIPVYRFDYRSVSQWRDGRMLSLDATTDDDGTVARVSARPDGSGLRLEGPEGAAMAPAAIFPTDHWNPGVIGATQVLNTISGKLNRVTMTREAREDRPTDRGPRPATRYRYAGDLEATVWYDDDGAWVGLRFAARDGSTIEYVCRRCGPAPELAEQPR